ncbi:MAG: hypothetical protein H0W88_12160 [Parachlamydiaceae bacterium]|nr:hypothetical protein [Parachlamydiaceae bacterium]
MTQKNPLHLLLAEAAHLLQELQTHDKPIKEIPPEVLQKLELLKQTIDIFTELNQRTYEAAGIDIETISRDAINSPNLPQKDKQFFERANKIEHDAKNIHDHLSKVLESKEKNKEKEKKTKIKKKKTKRHIPDESKKFKRLGDSDWISV